MSRSSHPSSSPTRRQFLGALGTGLVASVAGPTLLHATDKAGTKRPVIGSGEFTYEVYHDWGELPAGLKYGNTHGVAEDAQGRIYVHHTVHASSDRHDTMVVFDAKGRFVRSWGKEFEGGAHGLHILQRGKAGVPDPVRHQARHRHQGDADRRAVSGNSAIRKSRPSIR